jgi:hypothetical protein
MINSNPGGVYQLELDKVSTIRIDENLKFSATVNKISGDQKQLQT